MKQKINLMFATLAVLTIFSSCKKDEVVSAPSNPVIKTKQITVKFSNSSTFTFFSFKDTSVIANSDSATNKWDFALRRTTFLVNSNASGPGNAAVQMLDGIYDNITSAPSSGYAYDTSASKLAIKDGTWYNYNSSTHSFSPKAGKIFVFKTSNGNYAKMELLKVEYNPYIGFTPIELVYTFRYTYQPNGSKNF